MPSKGPKYAKFSNLNFIFQILSEFFIGKANVLQSLLPLHIFSVFFMYHFLTSRLSIFPFSFFLFSLFLIEEITPQPIVHL